MKSAIILISLAVLLLAVPSDARANRTEIMARAKIWVQQNIPYSQTKTHQGYRTDCSGYVSMAWGLSKPGLTTRELPTVTVPITKEQLLPGDILLNPGDHVVLFASWADSAKTKYHAWEESSTKTGTIDKLTVYPYWREPSAFHPRRWKNLA
eukprot:TRINITY_DN15546_c0_g1_i1.p2 TRINITY_DN15546_c0_g1~~TRINITY_DN15546_c0_g1_i1.p2  ORF type:complete len:152 (+),score=36.41 TRINITY_DN15546_c0_g1_i1:62-517(+)